MPEDVIETLAAFTPSQVNRDEMLFAAGKASARTPRIWKIAVVLLLLSQSLTLLGWLTWPRTITVAEGPRYFVTVHARALGREDREPEQRISETPVP